MEDLSARTNGRAVGFGGDGQRHSGSSGTQDADVEAQNHSRADKGARSPNRNIPSRDERHSQSLSPTDGHINRTETMGSRSSIKSLRRRGRVETSIAYGAEEMGRTTGWVPGLEPGVDTSDPPPYVQGDTEPRQDIRHLEQLHQKCEIMVVDYSPEHMSSQYLDNDNLGEFLAEPQEEWSQVRWINVNGLSWDVIKELGNHKNLHRLAIEDLMNTRNRTKADWYHDHTYIVLPLQKLVNVEDEQDSSSDDDDDDEGNDKQREHGDFALGNGNIGKIDTRARIAHERSRRIHAQQHEKKHKGAIRSLVQDFMRPKKQPKRPHRPDDLTKSTSFEHASKGAPWAPRKVRTLHQWHAGPNVDRIEYMERHSTLGWRGLGVSIEQVSIFLTSDNTVISFFEYSAQDVEIPIMRRLQSQSTVLRSSADASLLMQSILDTIIDLAIPVTTAYQDALGDLELDVLTDPNIQESTKLYILTSELAVLRNAIVPINQLIGSLREHKSTAAGLTLSSRAVTPLPQNNQLGEPPGRPQMRTVRSEIVPSGVTISDLTKTYLADVEDHTTLIQDSYDLLRRNADNLVDLIFNTVSAYQNEAMKRLTIVTAFFLPLTFLTGYFGMNFHVFAAVQNNSDSYFWSIAVPVCTVVLIILLREWIWRWIQKWANIALIKRGRKRRLQRARK